MVGNDRRVERDPVLLPHKIGGDCLGTPRCVRHTPGDPAGATFLSIVSSSLTMTTRRTRHWDAVCPPVGVLPRTRTQCQKMKVLPRGCPTVAPTLTVANKTSATVLQRSRNGAHNPLLVVRPPIQRHLLAAPLPVPLPARRRHHVARQQVAIMCGPEPRLAEVLWRILVGIRSPPYLAHRMSQMHRLLRPLASLCLHSLSMIATQGHCRRRRRNISGRKTKGQGSRTNMIARPSGGPDRNLPATCLTVHPSRKVFPPRSR